MWPVCEFLAAGCWAAAQSSTGVTLIRRCAGLPMQHELLSPIARALTLLQHPSRHTCPHTLCQRWQTDVVCRQDLKLPPVFRVQVGCEATDLVLGGDNTFSMLQIRPGDACFAVLEALSVAPLTRACAGGDAADVSRARVSRRTAVSPSPCHGVVTCTRIGCVIIFSERARTKSARMSAPQWEWYLTCVQHIPASTRAGSRRRGGSVSVL